MESKPTIYQINPDNTCRYALGTKGINPLIVIGINPSTADENIADRTINKVRRFAAVNDFDSYIMLNLYPQRTPFPDDLHAEADEISIKENLKHIESITSQFENPTILAAWSEKIAVRNYLKNCLVSIIEAFSSDNVKWIKLGEFTKSGHPRHPLYASYDLALTDFNCTDYLAKLIK